MTDRTNDSADAVVGARLPAKGAGDDASASTLAEKAYRMLREALLNGEFAPGQSISVRSTSSALGMGQMPIRSALNRLQAEGVFEMRENRTLAFPDLTPMLIIESRDIRIALEGLAAEMAAQRASAEAIRELDGHFKAMCEAAKSTEIKSYLEANLHFHMAVYQASGSSTLLNLIENIWVKLSAYTRLVDVNEAIDTLGNHLRALEGIRRRDSVMTRAAIVQDCCDSCEIQLRILAQKTAAVATDLHETSFGSMMAARRRGRPPKTDA